MIRRRGRACSAPGACSAARACSGAALLLIFTAACGGAPRLAVAPRAGAGAAVLQLQRDIDAILATPALERSTWGVAIASLGRDETLYAHNSQKLLLPASNIKLFTLAAAAERLGWTFSFETTLTAVGPIDGGVLSGDLVVVGTGDPSLDDWDGSATRIFTAWAEQLRAAGITVVTGAVVGDDNRLPDQLLGPGWAWDDLDRSFATATGALQFNQNTARLTVVPGEKPGSPALVAIAPPSGGLTIRGQITTTGPEIPAVVQMRRAAGSATLDVSGSIPLRSAPLIRNVSASNPTLYFVTALRAALIGAGIEIRGPAIDVDDLTESPALERGLRIVTYRSPPLSALAVTMMKVSQNLFAESLLAAIGGAGVVRSLLPQWDVPESSASIADGSGLSRYNLATAGALVAVLTRMYRDDRSRDLFAASLPVAGRDGTLAARMAGTAAEGNARAKTGALSDARALSGYVRNADGEPLVFSIIANNFGTTPDVIDAATDAIVVGLAEFSRR